MRDRSTVLSLWRALCAIILLGFLIAPAAAAAVWTVVQVRGTAFSLVGNKWEEMARGQEMPGEQVIRTLPSGRVQLDGAGGRLDMAGGTAIQLGANRITQFSGSLTVQTAAGGSLTIATDKIVANVRGTATLRFDGSDVSIEVAGGTVRVAGASQGQTINLVAGQSLDTADTPAMTASAAGDARSTNAAGGNPNANEAAGSNANAGGGNNAGNGNSNAGGNGNGNGNSGGGESNAGGNGNGNSGDNGNSGNAGNSGDNGNSGNNGSGNNGNGNGNGGG